MSYPALRKLKSSSIPGKELFTPIGTTVVFYVAARIYLLPHLGRLQPQSILIRGLFIGGHLFWATRPLDLTPWTQKASWSTGIDSKLDFMILERLFPDLARGADIVFAEK